MERARSSVLPPAGRGEDSTVVMQALLAPEAGRSRSEG